VSAAHLYPSRLGTAMRLVRRLGEPVVHCLRAGTILVSLAFVAQALAQTDPLPSWNAGRARNAIIDFVQMSTDPANPMFVPQEERIATFDQDGTLWVEQPIYTQLVYALDRVPVIVEKQPALKDVEPFKTVLSGNLEAISQLGPPDFEKIVAATITGLTIEEFGAMAKQWLATTTDRRWHRRYTELVYQPMLEVMQYLRANGYKTYIVTGGGQDFVRAFAGQVYGIPPEQVVGSAGATKYGYDQQNRPILMKEPKLLLNDNDAGKPEGIHFMIGRRPAIAFGNSSGDRQMLEYTRNGSRPGLAMLVLHDDATREYAYGPAEGLPDSKVGTFPQSLYDEAKRQSWVVVSMESDWKRIFAFDEAQ
jgi:phosphoglycolate phosphatase-like HAD superfamily hydrolase